MPDAPLGTHEEITNPLAAEHVDKLIEDRVRRVGMVSETVGRIAPDEVRQQMPLPAATPQRRRPVQLRVERAREKRHAFGPERLAAGAGDESS